MIVAAVVLVGAIAGWLVLGRKGSASDPAATPDTLAQQPAPAAAPDSAQIAAAAAAATMGFVRLIGDLPDDVIIWLDTTRQAGRTFTAAAGSYNLELETAEFEPYERRITVRAGDTTRVRIELALKSTESDSTTQPR